MALRKSASAPAKEDPQQHVLRKNYRRAIEIYRSMLAGGEDANTLLRLADCLVLDGQTAAAVAEYKKAAHLYGEQGFLLKAIGVNKKIVRLDPAQEEVHRDLSRLYEERGLLARPDESGVEVGATPAGSAGSAGGAIQFDMEASADDELQLELGTGAGLGSAPGEGSPGGDVDPEADVSIDDLDFGTGGDGAIESVPSSFDLGPGPAGATSAGASGSGSFDLAGGPALDELPEEISVDDLGAALADFTPEPAAAAGAPPELTRTPLFSDLTAAEFVEVVKEMGQETFHKDAVIVREGDPGDSLFVIVTGSVRVVTRTRGGDLKLADLGEGDFFGEGSLITGKPRTASIIANEESELLSLTKSALDAIARDHPRVREVMQQFYQQRAESTVKAILRSSKK